MNKFLCFVFLSLIIGGNINSNAQLNKQENLMGAEISVLSGGPYLGIRAWLSNFGYSAGLGTDWEFNDFIAKGKLMYSFNKLSNRFFLILNIGYYGFNDENSASGNTTNVNGSLFMLGLGVGYEWFITQNSAISIDGGYNLIGDVDYDFTINGKTYSANFSIPFWVGGSYTIYF